MARLNVEPEFFSDPRFLDLVLILGSQEQAVGMVVLFWMLAQKHWANNRELIPFEIFKRRDWGFLAEVGLAEIRDDGVYAKGSTQFEWILERKEAGKRGGNKSAELRASKSKQTEANASKSNPLLCSTTALLSSTKKTIERKTKQVCKTWPDNHIYAKVFTNLNRIPAYLTIFDVPNDEATIVRHMDHYQLSIADMEKISFQLAEWANDPNHLMKSPRGKLSTFTQNYAERRKKNIGPVYKQLTLEDY